MCLFSKNYIPSIASEDMYCYKEFVVPTLNSKILQTPYRDVKVNADSFPFLMKAEGPKTVQYYTRNSYVLTSGFIHAYTRTSFIKNYIYCAKRDPNFYKYFALVLCKIPKGVKYYISEDNSQICASEIILIRRII